MPPASAARADGLLGSLNVGVGGGGRGSVGGGSTPVGSAHGAGPIHVGPRLVLAPALLEGGRGGGLVLPAPYVPTCQVRCRKGWLEGGGGYQIR